MSRISGPPTGAQHHVLDIVITAFSCLGTELDVLHVPPCSGELEGVRVLTCDDHPGDSKTHAGCERAAAPRVPEHGESDSDRLTGSLRPRTRTRVEVESRCSRLTSWPVPMGATQRFRAPAAASELAQMLRSQCGSFIRVGLDSESGAASGPWG